MKISDDFSGANNLCIETVPFIYYIECIQTTW
jgi:hypothetical protein